MTLPLCCLFSASSTHLGMPMSAIPLVAVTSSSAQLTAQDTPPEYYMGSQNGIGSDFMHLAMLLHISLLAVCATTATNEVYGITHLHTQLGDGNKEHSKTVAPFKW
jgi:hypothetical protein